MLTYILIIGGFCMLDIPWEAVGGGYITQPLRISNVLLLGRADLF